MMRTAFPALVESRETTLSASDSEVIQNEDLVDMLPPVTAPAPEWNTNASALGGGHVVGINGLDLLERRSTAAATACFNQTSSATTVTNDWAKKDCNADNVLIDLADRGISVCAKAFPVHPTVELQAVKPFSLPALVTIFQRGSWHIRAALVSVGGCGKSIRIPKPCGCSVQRQYFRTQLLFRTACSSFVSRFDICLEARQLPYFPLDSRHCFAHDTTRLSTSLLCALFTNNPHFVGHLTHEVLIVRYNYNCTLERGNRLSECLLQITADKRMLHNSWRYRLRPYSRPLAK